MRKLLTVCNFFIFTTICLAQVSTVTATIQDPTTQIFANGTCTIQFVPTPGVPGPFSDGINTYSAGTTVPCSLDGTGSFSVSVHRNDFINPSGSKWQFTVCPNADATCTQVVIAIVSASINVSSTINAAVPIIAVQAGRSNPRAYQDSEIITVPNAGQQYWNTSSSLMRFWTGSTWVSALISGSTPTFATLNVTGNTTTGSLNTGSIVNTGNETIGGTLGVTGNATVGGNLGVTGSVTATSYNGAIYPVVVADDSTDNATTINNAITAAVAANSKVVLPCGRLKVNSALNLTNISSGITFEGCGANIGGFGENGISDTNITEIDCNTGTMCVDTTGSSHLTIKNIEFRGKSTASSPSTLGIGYGRDNAAGGGNGKFCFAQFNRLDHVVVWFDTNPTFNSGFGTIAIYNVGAEHWSMENSYAKADIGTYFNSTNEVGVSSPYQTFQTGCPTSMTLVQIDKNTSIHSLNFQPLIFGNTQVLTFNAYPHLSCDGTGSVAISFRGGSYANLDIGGQIENCGSAVVAASGTVLDKINLHPIVNSAVNTGLIALTTTTVTGSRFNLAQFGGTPQNLFQSGGGTIKGSYINLSGLAGSGGGGLTVTESEVFAPNLTDTNVNTFHAGSNYLRCSDTGCGWFGSENTTGQIVSTLPTGTAPFLITSTTPVTALTLSNHTLLRSCGGTNPCGNNAILNSLIVWDGGTSYALSGGTLTITGFPFSASNSFSCDAWDVTNSANKVTPSNNSGSSVTFTGTTTDGFRFTCKGN